MTPQWRMRADAPTHQRKVLAARRRNASENEVGDNGKREPPVHVGKRGPVSAQAREHWLRVDIQFAKNAGNLDQNAHALKRRLVIELRQS